MKRIIAMVLFTVFLLGGCADRLREPVTFYYVREEFEVDMSSVIDTEQREASGHRDDLSYLLALYFIGPASEELRSPFPGNVTLQDLYWNQNSVTLTLSDTAKYMTDAQYTLACGCLSLTAIGLSGADSVTIISGERSVTMTADSLQLSDHNTSAQEVTS